MPETRDPYESYLNQATLLFERGEIVKAGQIWQAILKKVPGHPEARAGLYRVKLYFDSRATQDGPPLPAPTGQAAAQDPALGRLLEEGCTLYDAGRVQEALARWEQVLARDPQNALAFGYLNGARRALGLPPLDPNPEPPAPQASTPAPPPPIEVVPPPPETAPDVDAERLLRDGCTLYDMGEMRGALDVWERLLAAEPGHALARQYAAQARRDLGLPPSEGEAPPPEPPPAAPEPAPAGGDPSGQADLLVRDGIQLFDMGMDLEAMRKWEQALALFPGHADAAAYLEMARRERDKVPAKAPEPAPAAPSPAGPDPLDLQLCQAEKLLAHGKAEEAHALFERVLRRAPGLERALTGRREALGLLEARAPEVEVAPCPPPSAVEAPALPPPTVTEEPLPPRRGPALPEALRHLQLPPMLMNPLVLMGIFFGILILWVAMYFLGQVRSNSRLKGDVASIRAACLASVARSTDVAALAEEPSEVRKEAERCLGDDPFRAYCRAQELLRVNPLDAPAAQLLDRATQALRQGEAPKGDMAQVDRLLGSGEVEGAERLLYALLRQTPDEPELRNRYVRSCLVLAQAKALKEQWEEAREMLLRGRAMNPSDRTWHARLRLLEQIQAMGRPEREAWIPMLG